jgi:hypothetical protein
MAHVGVVARAVSTLGHEARITFGEANTLNPASSAKRSGGSLPVLKRERGSLKSILRRQIKPASTCHISYIAL